MHWNPNRLREMRETAKWSQVELHDRTGIPQKTLSNWEKGKGEPSASDLSKLAKAPGKLIKRGRGRPPVKGFDCFAIWGRLAVKP